MTPSDSLELSDSLKTDWQQEGSARFHTGDAFFRASSRTGRDLAVLAAAFYRAQQGQLRVVDAMTGCGVRPLRYALEAGADYVWANEGNGDLRSLIQSNLSHSLTDDRYKITHQDANALFFDCHARQDFYDLIDVDSFGSPMPTLITALWAVKIGGLLYLTSTDGRVTSGRAPNKSLQTYGAYARSHPAVHEQGLRLLLGTVMQQAAAKGLCAEPIFSFYSGEVNRVMVRITRQSWQTKQYGFLAYCHGCGQFQTVAWKKLGQVDCVCQPAFAPAISGPMWLGPLHNAHWLAGMKELAILHGRGSATARRQGHTSGTSLKIEPLAKMPAEIDLPPYFYPLAEIGRRAKIDIPPSKALVERLRQQGFLADWTHLDHQAIKTDAPMAVCLKLAKQIASEIAQKSSLEMSC